MWLFTTKIMGISQLGFMPYSEKLGRTHAINSKEHRVAHRSLFTKCSFDVREYQSRKMRWNRNGKTNTVVPMTSLLTTKHAYTMCYDFLESGGIPIPLFFIMSITRAAVHEKPLPPSPSPVKGL